MSRRPTGTVYEHGGSYYARAKGLPRDLKLLACPTKESAIARKNLLVVVLTRLKGTLHADLAGGICAQLAEANEERTRQIMAVVEGLLAGRERRAAQIRPAAPGLTVRQFGEQWTSGELYRRFPTHLKEIDQSDNKTRLEKYVYPVLEGVPMSEFSVDHADLVLAQPAIPKRSLRHVSLVIHRLVNLAVYPGRVLAANPLPRGWLPKPNKQKAKGWLYPLEDALLMGCTSVPLVRRMYEGFLDREGPRETEAALLEWTELDLDHPDGGGSVNLDENKTDDPRSWALDRGMAEAFRRWKRLCPSSKWVFPNDAVPRARKKGAPMIVSHAAEKLREDLIAAGVTRAALFEGSARRIHLRAHDLRATFITISLANGRTETWVQDRSGHGSTIMINAYRRQARKAAELNLGPLTPLYLAIPELAAMGPAPWEAISQPSLPTPPSPAPSARAVPAAPDPTEGEPEEREPDDAGDDDDDGGATDVPVVIH